MSSGFSDFKRRWGNRKLEDNWRRANRSNSDITNNTLKFLNSHGAGPQAIRVGAGLVLIPVAIFTCRALADGTARAARALLQH